MFAMRSFFLGGCLLGVVISPSGGSVSLEIVGGKTSFEEDSDVELFCKITPYNNEMTWFVNNDPYALCISGFCSHSSNKPFTFGFNFDDEPIGEFRLTISPVNLSHADLSFACDDGNERKFVTFEVTTGDGDNSDSNLGGPVGGGGGGGLVVIIIIVIVVKMRLSEKKEIYLLNVGQRGIKLGVERITKGNGTKTYTVVCSENKEEVYSHAMHDENNDFIPEFQIPNLEPSTSYTINLKCSVLSIMSGNAVEESEDVLKKYQALEVTTCGPGQTTEGKDFYLLNVGQTSIKVCWKRLTKDGSPPKRYTLTCLGSRTTYTKTFEDKVKDVMIYTITGLKPLCSYKISLRRVWLSKTVLEQLDVTTHGQMTDQAAAEEEFYFTNVEQGGSTVRWKKYEDGEYPKSYSLTCNGNRILPSGPMKKDGKFMEQSIGGLSPSTLYQLILTCSDDETDQSYPGEMLKKYRTLNFKTLDTPSDIGFTTSEIRETSITVQWKGYIHPKATKKYILSYFNDDKTIDETIDDKEDLTHQVNGLKQSALYEFILRCCDESHELLRVYKPLYILTGSKNTGHAVQNEEYETNKFADFSILEVTATSIKLRWKVCKSWTKSYLLSYFENGTTYDELIDYKGDKDFEEHTLTGLTPSALHEVNLKCLNKSKSLLNVYKPLYQRTNDIPHDDEFWTSEVDVESIEVRWKICNMAPSTEKYVLSIFVNGRTEDIPLGVKRKKEFQDYRLTKLKASTLYELILRCTDKSGKLLKIYKPLYKVTKGKDAAQTVAEETFDTPESAGINEFCACTITDTCIKVSWKKYKSKDSSEKKYDLSYFENGKTVHPINAREIYKNKSEKNNTFSIATLKPSTLYELNLRCLDKTSNKLLKVYQPLYKRTNANKTTYKEEMETAT